MRHGVFVQNMLCRTDIRYAWQLDANRLPQNLTNKRER